MIERIERVERMVRKLPLERLSRRDRTLALRAIEADAARELAEREKRRATLERLTEEHRRAVAEILNEKQARQLSAAARREKAALRALRRTPGGAPRDGERAVRHGRKRLAHLARELGVDLKRVRDLGDAFGRRFAKSTEPAAAAVTTSRLWDGFLRTVGTGHPHLAPPDATLFPPFLLGLMYHASEVSDDFSVGYDWEIDETSGKVTARTRMRCPDAGFWIDHAWVWVDAVQVFQYTAPRTGRLSVIVELVNLEGRSEVALADEFGLSSSNTNLRNYMTLRVYHPAVPDISFAEMSHMSRTGTSGTVAESNYYPGSTYLATFESQGTVEAGDTFFAAVGTRNSDRCTTDDVEVTTRSDFSWQIRSLELRILDGGPVIPVVGRPLAARRKRRGSAR